jgi:hypothetical protein
MSGDKTPVHVGTVGLKEKALHGAVRFAGMFVYLWAMFILFQLHDMSCWQSMGFHSRGSALA